MMTMQTFYALYKFICSFLKKYNKNHYFVYLCNGAFYGPHIPSSACCFFTSYSSFSSSSSPSSQNHNLFFFLALFWRLFGDFGNYFILCWYTPVTLYLFQQKNICIFVKIITFSAVHLFIAMHGVIESFLLYNFLLITVQRDG